MPDFSAADHAHMTRALALAQRGLFTTTPNPRVGCVVVKDGAVIGEGFHLRPGEPHAEIHALAQARAQRQELRGATLYVTLEPCNHHGRTPPCVDVIIAAGIARVVAAMADPNPAAGRGAERLRASNIAVDLGLLEEEATELNIGFVTRMRRGTPWVRVKVATSIDGRSALANGASQWITGPNARADGHAWRARACAILTGIGTILHDDPELTVRDVATPRQPLRVLVDRNADTPPKARALAAAPALVVTAGARNHEWPANVETLVLPDRAGRIDLAAMMRSLAGRGINEVHVEAGARLNGALLSNRLVDELLIYFAPSVLGAPARRMSELAAPRPDCPPRVPARGH